MLERDSSPEDVLRTQFENLIVQFGIDAVTKIAQEREISNSLESKRLEHAKLMQTLSDAIMAFTQSAKYIGYADQTKLTYETQINQLVKYAGQATACNEVFNAKFLKRYVETTSPNANTRNKRISFLRTFINVVLGKSYIDENGLSGTLKVLDVDPSLPRAFNKEQLLELFHHVRQTKSGLRDHAIVSVLLGSGIRLDELTGLQIKHFNPTDGKIFVHPKGNKGVLKARNIRPSANMILSHYINFTYGSNAEPGYIFRNSEGPKISNRCVQKMVKRLIDKSESIPEDLKFNYSVHSFRHTFAIQFLTSGVDIYTISKLLGHTTVKSTEKYLLLFDDYLKSALEKHPFADADLDYIIGGGLHR